MKIWIYNPGTSDDPRFAGDDWEEYEVEIEVWNGEVFSVTHPDPRKADYAYEQIISNQEMERRIVDQWINRGEL